jgi:hypothetical protein
MRIGSAQSGNGDDARSSRSGRPDIDAAGRSGVGDRSRPTLLVNPQTDGRLRSRLEMMLDEHGPATPGDLEALVKPEYPRLVVRARSLEHESLVVWYVYREGYWVPATKDEATG